MAYVLGLWRLASDMGFAGQFGITGLFSHWQIWMLVGAVIQATAAALNRYGQGIAFRLPTVLPFYPREPKHAPEPRKINSR